MGAWRQPVGAGRAGTHAAAARCAAGCARQGRCGCSVGGWPCARAWTSRCCWPNSASRRGNAFVSEFAERLRQKPAAGHPRDGRRCRAVRAGARRPLRREVAGRTGRRPAGAHRRPHCSLLQQTGQLASRASAWQDDRAGGDHHLHQPGPRQRIRTGASPAHEQPRRARRRTFPCLVCRRRRACMPESLQGDQRRTRAACCSSSAARLEACRAAVATVYAHLDEHGVSVSLVFRIRQVRERILRIRALVDCLQEPARRPWPLRACWPTWRRCARTGAACARWWRRTLRLLAAKVTERSSEVGEHYITRDRQPPTGPCCARPQAAAP
jgi:hypothetical protein